MQEDRVNRMHQTVKNLQSLGFEITVNGCLKVSKGQVVGRPHIVKALNLSSNENNKAVLENICKDMEREAEHDERIKQRYELMISKGEQQYPYILLLSTDAFISDIYIPSLNKVSFDKSVSLIRNAGGLAMLAHYWTARDDIVSEMLEKIFQEDRLDGAETVFGLWEYLKGGKDVPVIDEDRKLLKSLVEKYNKLASGGADIHRREDFEEFANANWYAQETIGMARRIINCLNPNNQWHSLANLWKSKSRRL